MKKVFIVLADVCLLFLLCSCQSKSTRWQEQYDLGSRFLSEGNYEDAIIAFTAAIEIDARRAPAFAGRGDAYLGSAHFDEAVDDYLTAIERDPLAEYYLRLSNGYLAKGDLASAIEALQEGYETTKDPVLQERITALEYVSTFQGGVFAWGEGYLDRPISDAVVTLRDVETGNVVITYKTNTSGMYSGYAIEGEYEFFAHAEGYQSASIYKSIGLDETEFVENIYLLPQGEEGTGLIHGTVYSAVSGEPISGARVWTVADWNQQDIDYEETNSVISNSEGEYIIPEQPIGYYTIFASYDDYVTASVNGVSSNTYEANWDIMLSPRLEEGEELRIVLTWGSEPEDLDSHLIVDSNTWEDGIRSENDVFYNNMDVTDSNRNLIAQLDVDDTTSYGPETITIYNMQNHEFTYLVHDYTNGERTGSTALSMSEANIVVYGKNGLLGTFHVPTAAKGTIWVVFSVDGDGVVRSIGEIVN